MYISHCKSNECDNFARFVSQLDHFTIEKPNDFKDFSTTKPAAYEISCSRTFSFKIQKGGDFKIIFSVPYPIIPSNVGSTIISKLSMANYIIIM